MFYDLGFFLLLFFMDYSFIHSFIFVLAEYKKYWLQYSVKVLVLVLFVVYILVNCAFTRILFERLITADLHKVVQMFHLSR